MELCSIASGSNGNCIYVGNKSTNILVDVGISKKKIEEGLKKIEINPAELHGIVITHEHSDHISGLGVMIRKYNIPVYATAETVQAIFHSSSIGRVESSLFHFVEPDQSFQIQDITVMPFSTSHDAANPVCYTFQADGRKIGVATDLGTYNDYIINHLTDSDALLLEANHDVHMLEAGTYPYSLKRRILGDRGHLSNENSGILLSKLWTKRLKYIFLGHLSEENNFPDLAYETVKLEMAKLHNDYESVTHIEVAKRGEPSLPVIVS